MNDLYKAWQAKIQEYSPTATLEAVSENPEITIKEFVEKIIKHQDLHQAIGDFTLQQLAKAVGSRKTPSREIKSNLDETVLNLLFERKGEELSVAEVQQNIDPEIPQATIRNALKKLARRKRVIEGGNVTNRKYSIAQSNEQ